jgi:hypothetical protein
MTSFEKSIGINVTMLSLYILGYFKKANPAMMIFPNRDHIGVTMIGK